MSSLTEELRERIRFALADWITGNELWEFLTRERTGPWTDTVFEDLRPIEVHRAAGAGAPDQVQLFTNCYAHGFDSSLPEYITYVFHIPHTFKRGSTPTFHLHTSHNTASPVGTKVRWNTNWRAARGYSLDAFDAAGIDVAGTQTPSARYVHDIFGEDPEGAADVLVCPAELVELLEPDSIVYVVLNRDPAHGDDDFGQDIMVITADLHIEMERDGTTERNHPFTSGGWD